MTKHIAYFISAHGFGHAARSAAIIASLQEHLPDIDVHMFTTVPDWFFAASLTRPYTLHPTVTDVGLVQTSPVEEDLTGTLQHLQRFLPFSTQLIQTLAAKLHQLAIDGVVCDISPLGLEAARAANLPSILVENFTWDWIYQGYLANEPRFSLYIDQLGEIFQSARHRVQTKPFCAASDGAYQTSTPVSRKPRTAPAEIRCRLDIPPSAKAVLISMGGIQQRYQFLNRLQDISGVYFIIPGNSQEPEAVDNLRLLPHHSEYYHPDLLNACDAVVGKVGYSTLAEAYHAGIPFGLITREKFRESPVLTDYVLREMSGFEISNQDFFSGDWANQASRLLSLNGFSPRPVNGADEAAQWILDILR